MAISAVSFGQSNRNRANIDAFINLDDNSIREIAKVRTQQNVDTKKYDRLDKTLDVALPIAGGISAAAYAAKGSRLKAFGKGAALWGLFIGGINAAFGIANAVKRNNDSISDFAKKHPILSFAGAATAAYFAGMGMIKGGAKVFEKLSKTNVFKTATKKASKILTDVKGTKFVKGAIDMAATLSKKTHPALKEAAKVAAIWAPAITIIGSLTNSIGYRNKVTSEYCRNYNDLKTKQLELAKRRNAELEVQRDFLLTDKRNREDLALAGLN